MKRYVHTAFMLIALSFIPLYAEQEVQYAVAAPAVQKTSLQIPSLLAGIWQGSDRLMRLSADGSGFSIVLRTFYSWYDDRTAEDGVYTAQFARDRNDTTSVSPQNMTVSCRTLIENSAGTAGVYELLVMYANQKNNFTIPVAIIDGNLYLDFFIHTSSSYEYWRAGGGISGITVSVPRVSPELLSYVVDGSSCYPIRYWQSEMEYTADKAYFVDGNTKYSVDKFIRSGDVVYTCTTGKSFDIHNIKKTGCSWKMLTDSDGVIGTISSPYLIRVPGSENSQQFQSIIAENNKRRHPGPKPLFPPSEINFHWKEIDELEKYNPWTWNRRNIDLGK